MKRQGVDVAAKFGRGHAIFTVAAVDVYISRGADVGLAFISLDDIWPDPESFSALDGSEGLRSEAVAPSDGWGRSPPSGSADQSCLSHVGLQKDKLKMHLLWEESKGGADGS